MAEENLKAPVIRIQRYRVNLDPEIALFHVEVARDDGVWEETLGSEHELRIFLQGVRAGSREYVPLPEIPSAETAVLVVRSSPDYEPLPAGDDIPF